jgi:DNA-binding NtrC family response regulator
MRNPLGSVRPLKIHSASKPESLEQKLDATERDLILQALNRTNWVLGGADGAASLLGLKRTGLLYKMHRLGISRIGEKSNCVAHEENVIRIDAPEKKEHKRMIALQRS